MKEIKVSMSEKDKLELKYILEEELEYELDLVFMIRENIRKLLTNEKLDYNCITYLIDNMKERINKISDFKDTEEIRSERIMYKDFINYLEILKIRNK